MKKRILIIEDEPAFAKMVKLRLQSAGFDVSIAADAYHGIMEVLKGNPDLVVLDLKMPAGGGFGILERMRGVPSKAMLPVVILTGIIIDAGTRAKAEAYDVAAVFTKPYESKQFISKIRSLISA